VEPVSFSDDKRGSGGCADAKQNGLTRTGTPKFQRSALATKRIKEGGHRVSEKVGDHRFKIPAIYRKN